MYQLIKNQNIEFIPISENTFKKPAAKIKIVVHDK